MSQNRSVGKQVTGAMPKKIGKPGPSSKPNAASGPTTTYSIYLRRGDISEFTEVYRTMVREAERIEASSKDINQIVSANYQIYLFLNSFLDKVRKNVQGQLVGGSESSDKDSVLVTLRDLSSLELESEQRLMRAIVARNAITTGIGDTLIASVSQKDLVDELQRSLATFNEQTNENGSSGADEDDTAEERDPLSVNLSNNKGLYAILDKNEAFAISDLIGYQNEARELLAYCRDIQFIDSNNPAEVAPNRNPICVVLYGPPGSGKTTIAQAVARQLDYIYMYVNAENVVSSWAGGTEKNIAKLFRRARIASKQNSGRRVLMLIDEIDGLLKNRASALNITGEEYNRITTFLQMLTPPVGVNNSCIVALFTTNLLQNIDSAVINRCRGRIFMGYIVKPNDRLELIRRIFSPYVNYTGSLPDSPFDQLANVVDDLVPRDYQNILAQIKNIILEKYEKENPGQALSDSDIRIDLSQKNNLIDGATLWEAISRAEPATRVSAYIEQFRPPAAHVCTWLNSNAKNARSYPIFLQYAQQERLNCN